MPHQVELLNLAARGCLDLFQLRNQLFTTADGTVEGIDPGDIGFAAPAFNGLRDLVPVVVGGDSIKGENTGHQHDWMLGLGISKEIRKESGLSLGGCRAGQRCSKSECFFHLRNSVE